MSATVLTVTPLARTGVTPALAAANADGSTFANDGRTFLHLKNTNGTARNVTIASSVTVDGLAVADVTVQIPLTSGDKMIGPFEPGIFGTTVTITFDAVADLTIQAFRV